MRLLLVLNIAANFGLAFRGGRYFRRIAAYRKGMASSSSTTPSPQLDKSQFEATLSLVALKIPAKLCTQYMSTLREHLFQRPRMKRVFDVPDCPTDRLLLLGESVDMGLSVLSPEQRQFVKDNCLGEPEAFSLKLGYEHLSADEVLRKILPADSEIPSSFEQAGHIAHLNLREEMLPYKQLIGRVILDKNPTLRTVVNKMGNIENEFRTFPMEVLAGEDNLVVTVRESGARFTFNFRNVYWNSRLQTEHARLIELIIATAKKRRSATDPSPAAGRLVVADMMAGVGPFAVPLAMTSEASVTVYANDLNPESYSSLTTNARTNHCSPSRLVASNADARAFVIALAARGERFHEAIMNLPANATDFLDVFIGLERRYAAAAAANPASSSSPSPSPSLSQQPRIHVYGFSSAADVIADMVERAAASLRCPVSSLGPAVSENATMMATTDVDNVACWGHVVRDVSPKKMMVCLSFRLPVEVARAEPLDFSADVGTGEDSAVKKRKLE